MSDNAIHTAREAFIELYGPLSAYSTVRERAAYLAQMGVFVMGFEAGVRWATEDEHGKDHAGGNPAGSTPGAPRVPDAADGRL